MVCSIVLYTKTCQNGKGHKPIDNFQGNVHICYNLSWEFFLSTHKEESFRLSENFTDFVKYPIKAQNDSPSVSFEFE